VFLAIRYVRANDVVVDAKARGGEGLSPSQRLDERGEKGVGEGSEGGGMEGGEGGRDIVLENWKEIWKVGKDDLGAEKGKGNADW